MGDLINLRRARKAKSRSEREADAAANRVAFGRSKAEMRETTLLRERATRQLDGLRRDVPDTDA